MENTHVVIMAGGVGSRLWPISRPEMPKQFIDVLGVGKSMIQLTVERFSGVCSKEHFWVVTSEHYVDTVMEQLPEIPRDQILAEPEPRNTAPCIAYACRKIGKRYPEANIVVTPSDALVLDTGKFVDNIAKALEFTGTGSGIVTVGITPTRPETGYGYIHSSGAVENSVCKVTEFCEKPCLETAKAYLAEGGFFWNAGIFIWNAGTINAQLRRFAPQISSVMDRLEPSFYTDREQDELKRLFHQCEKISIDYAVMEKSSDIYVIPCNPGWSDLGSWGSVKTHIADDEDGNSVVGDDVRLFGCRNCIVHAGDARTVVAEGLDGYIISEKDGDILVCRLSEEQRIKEFSACKSKGNNTRR
ncbi:MAG: mannose-1-phosphate guanylyltransferase [Bacteroidales bacterium]|nr:mannose-1-phosphate guanylyltransferase [Bacteroidales bacterium]